MTRTIHQLLGEKREEQEEEEEEEEEGKGEEKERGEEKKGEMRNEVLCVQVSGESY